MKGGRDR
jgi:hypothetical protein